MSDLMAINERLWTKYALVERDIDLHGLSVLNRKRFELTVSD
jgi:hypothetical protein